MPRSSALSVDLVELMEQRQTRRDFSQELSLEDLGDFLWLACRSRSSRPSEYGPNQESRPHPSAGALHPVHVLLASNAVAMLRYDPVQHALFELPASASNARQTIDAAKLSLDLGRGWVLALVAEPGKTGSKYEDPDSLVLRDAGVVLGYMSFVAEALGLAFCPLGITGNPGLTQGFPSAEALRAVGLAVLGKA
jgi:SagB-type dehydrogenase family enzyme